MKRRRKKKKVIIISVVILVIILIVGGVVIIPKLFKKEEVVPQVVDSIEAFGYTLDDRDTNLMKDTYKELKEILNADTIKKEEYAKTLSKLFIIDFFTINNKRNKYDVGGTEYIYPDSVENFKLNAEDTIYKTIKTNNDGKRDQNLPIVKAVNVLDLKQEEFTIGEEKYTSYIMNMTWEYEKDYGYDKKATITAIEKEEKIYIVEYKVGE